MKPIPGICDRCGQRYRLSQLQEEYLLGRATGLRVCPSCYDESHPQLDTRHVKTNDKQSVKDSRSDRAELAESRRLFSWNPVGHPTTSTMFMETGRVRVTTFNPDVTVYVTGPEASVAVGDVRAFGDNVADEFVYVFGFHVPVDLGVGETTDVTCPISIDVTMDEMLMEMGNPEVSIVGGGATSTSFTVTMFGMAMSLGNESVNVFTNVPVTSDQMTAGTSSVSVIAGNVSVDVTEEQMLAGLGAIIFTSRVSASPSLIFPTGMLASAGIASASGSGGAVTAWPSSANTGYLRAPGYPGSLTPWTGGAGPGRLTANTTYSFYSFPASGDVVVDVPNVTFIGCQFLQEWQEGWSIKVLVEAPVAATFKFCTIRPDIGTNIPNPAWPSAGAGLDIDGSTGGGFEPYQIPYNKSYQYGIIQDTGGIIVEDCDIWGFGNSICFFGRTYQNIVRRTWVHDASAEGSGATMYHTDGPGHLNFDGCDHVLIEDCTIASLGNTNAIAFQGGIYNDIIVRRNYLSGFSTCVDIGHNTPGNTNLVFQDNIIATDIAWRYAPLYANYVANFSQASNLWRGNRFRVMPGTKPRPGSSLSFTIADDNKFIWPDGTLRTTDYE